MFIYETFFDRIRIGSEEAFNFVLSTGGRVVPDWCAGLRDEFAQGCSVRFGEDDVGISRRSYLRGLEKLESGMLEGLERLVRPSKSSHRFDGYVDYLSDPGLIPTLLIARFTDFSDRFPQFKGLFDRCRELFMYVLGVYPVAEAEVRFLSTVRLSMLIGPYPDFSESNLLGKPEGIDQKKAKGRVGPGKALRFASFLWISFYTFWQYRSYQQSVYGFGLTQMYSDNTNNSLMRYYRRANPSEIMNQLHFKIAEAENIRRDSRRFDLMVETLLSSVGYDEALKIMDQTLADVYEMKKIVRKNSRYKRVFSKDDGSKRFSEDLVKKNELLSRLILSGFGCRDIFSLVSHSEDVKGLVRSLEIVFGAFLLGNKDGDGELAEVQDRLSSVDRLTEFLMKARNLYDYKEPAGGLIVEIELTGKFGLGDEDKVEAGSPE